MAHGLASCQPPAGVVREQPVQQLLACQRQGRELLCTSQGGLGFGLLSLGQVQSAGKVLVSVTRTAVHRAQPCPVKRMLLP